MSHNDIETYLSRYPMRTRQTYERALRSFIAWYQGTFGEPPEWRLVTQVEVRDYMAYLQSVKRMSAASVNLYLAAIRAYLRHNGRTIHVRGPRQTKPPVRALSARDLGRLLAAAENNPRDYAILSLMARAGLRVSEVIALEVSDLDLRERSGWVTIRQGKGNKSRKVPLGLEVRKALHAWLSVRPQSQSPLLFLSRTFGPLTARDIQRRVVEYAHRAKLQNVTPHTLRHTFATRAIENGVDLATLQAILGHESISTTSRYLHPTEARMAESVEKL